MDKLPKVFANPIEKEFSNVQSFFRDNGERSEIKNNKDINKKINEIFAAKNHVYKSKVRINFFDHNRDYVIVGKTNAHLLTIDGELVKISDIKDIEKI